MSLAITDNVTIRLTRLVERKQGFFNLPIFSYDFSVLNPHAGSTDITVDSVTITVDDDELNVGAFTWNGASQIITQFNYQSPNNFVIVQLPEPPTDADFCLCIRYRIGETVYRWKLWEGVGEVLNEAIYSGQIIKKNFVLEVWSTESTNEVNNPEVIEVISSILALTDDPDVQDYEVVTGVEHNNLLNIEDSIAIDTTHLNWWYSTDRHRLVVDALGNITQVPVYLGTGGDLTVWNSLTEMATTITIVAGDPDLANSYFPAFDVSHSLVGGPTTSARKWLGMVKMTLLDGVVVICNNFTISLAAGIVTVQANGLSTTFANSSSWLLIEASIEESGGTVTNFSVSVSDINGVYVHTYTTDVSIPLINDGVAMEFLTNYVGDFMSFDDTDVDLTAFYQLLRHNYGFLSVPLEYDPAGAFEDNEP